MPKKKWYNYGAAWTMKPVIVVNYIYGLRYYSNSSNRKFKYLKFIEPQVVTVISFIYSVMIFIMQFWFCASLFEDILSQSWNENLEAKIRYCTQMLYSVVGLINILYSVLISSSLNQLMWSLDRWDKGFRGARKYSKNLKMKLVIFSVFCVIVSIVGQVQLFIKRVHDPFYKFVVFTWMSSLRICLFPFLGMQFVGIVGLIRGRLTFINEELILFEKNSSAPERKKKFLKRKVMLVTTWSKFSKRSHVAFIQFLRTAHKDLLDISQSVNSVFNFILFCSILNALIMTTLISYLVLFDVDVSIGTKKSTLHLVARAFCILVCCILMVNESGATANESKRTIGIVHRIQLSNPSEELQLELNLFTNQLLLGGFSYHAFEIFDIDKRLLYSMAQAFMMCFVVLMQMKVSEMPLKYPQSASG